MSKNPPTKTNAHGLPDLTPAQMVEIQEFESVCMEIEETLLEVEYPLGFDVLATILCDWISGISAGPVKQTAELERFAELVEVLLLKTRGSKEYFAKMERKMGR
tara:strand:- start:1360 stop:1671 length:312 start_codon:yes stop_codon:yes gene_type:complete